MRPLGLRNRSTALCDVIRYRITWRAMPWRRRPQPLRSGAMDWKIVQLPEVNRSFAFLPRHWLKASSLGRVPRL